MPLGRDISFVSSVDLAARRQSIDALKVEFLGWIFHSSGQARRADR